MNSSRLPLVFLFLIVSNFVFGQYVITIDLVAMDKQSRKPIPFVKAGFEGRNIKTIGKENGRFILLYNESAIGNKDVFEVSAIGYKPFRIKAHKIFDYFEKEPVVYLEHDETYVKKNRDDLLTGEVFTAVGPVEGANVSVKNSLKSVLTDAEGRFFIDAAEGDILKVSFFGMLPQEVPVTGNHLKILMQSESELLDEVTIEDKSGEDKKLDMGYSGDKTFNQLGNSAYFLNEKDIKGYYVTLADVINGRIPGARASENANGTIVYLRSSGSIYGNAPAIFDIDGMVYEGRAPYIDPQNIAYIAILKSLASTNKYGSMARGGVVIIRTKNEVGTKSKAQKKALVEGNDYNEAPPTIASQIQKPFYIRALEKTASLDEAKKIYKGFENLKTSRGIPFFINTSEYFATRDSGFADAILNEAVKLVFTDPNALRSLAFECDKLEMYNKSLEIYQRIATLQPKNAQSYLDLAESMVDNKFYREAMQLYRKMLFNQIKGVDFSGIIPVIEPEIQNLLSTQRTKVNFKALPPGLLRNGFEERVRIFVEWNNPAAEFEMQFVNPMKKYFIWSHTQTGNSERIEDEFKKGYQVKSFLIGDEFPGKWIVNFQNFKKADPLNPVYIKYTVYRNYGTDSQTKTVKLFKPGDLFGKVTLDVIEVQ